MRLHPLVIFLESLKAKSQTAAGFAILISVLLALLWANSPWNEYYLALVNMEITIGVNGYMLSEPFLVWVNDGLMAVFFLFVGLELKREILGGKLSNFKLAVLPVGAALGGMIVPAAIYAVFNHNSAAFNGWGIPMATDIAFALGVLSLFGDKVPVVLKVFLVALAIVDDLGAVMIIAFFYTSGISVMDLFHAFMFFVLLLGANYFGVRSAWLYAVVGIGGVWLAFFFSGVHPTIAGVLIAFAIPGKVKINEEEYLRDLNQLHLSFIKARSIKGDFISEKQLDILEQIKSKSDDAETPLQKIEYALSPVVGFFILPLFALVSAGIHLHGNLLSILAHPISLGIFTGLLAGKSIGILAASWLLVTFNIAQLPQGITWWQLSGVALIAGIGFTMSLFITELAFEDHNMTYIAKVSILFSSLVAGILGVLLLRTSVRPKVTLVSSPIIKNK